MLAYSLRTYDEVRDSADLFDAIPDAKPNAQMIDIATRIIEQQEGAFDPTGFNDRYEDALRALIREKEKGAGRKVTVEEPEDTNVVDLMEALRKSLGQSGPAEARGGPAAKQPRRPAQKTGSARRPGGAKKRA